MSEQERTFRIVTRANDGTIRTKDYPSQEPLFELHTQIGVDDCSTNLTLRGLPVFRGLIGPMADENGTVRAGMETDRIGYWGETGPSAPRSTSSASPTPARTTT